MSYLSTNYLFDEAVHQLWRELRLQMGKILRYEVISNHDALFIWCLLDYVEVLRRHE